MNSTDNMINIDTSAEKFNTVEVDLSSDITPLNNVPNGIKLANEEDTSAEGDIEEVEDTSAEGDIEEVEDVGDEDPSLEENVFIQDTEMADVSYGGAITFDFDEELINDNILIDKQRVINQVKKYLNNYYSSVYQKYKTTLGKLYSKVGGKKFEIIRQNNHIYLTKVGKGISNALYDISNPKYLFVKERLVELEYEIKNKKIELDTLYNKIKLMNERPKAIITNFEKIKLEYIRLLEEFEVLNLYYIMFNKIDTNISNKEVIYQKNIKKDSKEDSSEYLEGHTYQIPENIVLQINQLQSSRLDMYNNIMNLLKGSSDIEQDKLDKDSEVYKLIKEYIVNNEINEYIKQTDDLREKQDKYVNFIILEVPKVVIKKNI